MFALLRLTFVLASLVCVLSQNVDPNLSYFYGAGASFAQAGSPAFFFIQPVDSTGKNITSCGVGPFRILLTRAGSTTPIPGTTVSCDPITGAYQSSYVVRVATQWTMNVTYQNALLKNGSVAITAVAGPISGPNSPASGSGLQGGVVGVNHYFNITGYDAYDNRNYSCLATNSDWEILVKGGPTQVYTGSLASCANGIYTLRYEANYTGAYNIYVAVTGNPTMDSPYPITLTAGPIDPKHTTASGSGLTTSIAGQNAPITISVRDQFNNAIDTCLNASDYRNFEITLTNGQVTVQGQVTGCNNGVYTATYNATVADTYTLSIKYLGVDIENSPFKPVISPGDISGSTSIVQGSALTQATAGIPALFIVIPYDQFKNPIKSCTARFSDFVTQLHYLNGSSKYDVTGRVTGCVNPWFNYTISYTATKRGSYSLTVQYKGQTLDNSPYYPFVESGSLSPPNTNATGALTYAQVGIKEVVIIHAYDSYDNKIYQCDNQYNKWTVVLNNLIYGSVIDCKEGNYTAVYEITKINNYILEIEFVGNPIEDSPFFIQALPGPPDPAHCVMTGEGLSIAYAGSKANFTVACSDKYDNPITQCFYANQWVYTLSGPGFYNGTASSCTNQTQGAAQYYFEYTAFISGRYVLHVTFTNVTLPDHNPKVLPGPLDPASTYAEGPGVSIDPSNIAGSSVMFKIIAKDKYNNSLDSSCPDPKGWKITFTPSITGPLLISCSPNNEIIVTYTAEVARVYQVDIRYNDVPILKNPYTAQIFAGPIDASSSRAQGTALTYGVAGEAHVFWIVTYDKYGNAIQQCTASLSDFTVVLSGPKLVSLEDKINNCTRGVYYGSYDAYKAGTYTLQLNYLNTPVDKSPYHPVIVAADIYGPNCVPTGPGLLSTPAGVTTYITLFCEDRFENPIRECRNDTISNGFWKTNTSGGNFYFQPVKCYPGGNYDFEFYATKVGVWDLTITYKGQPTHGSPLAVTIVAGPIDPPSTTALSGVTTARVGETTTIQVQGKDKFGNINGTCFDNKHWGVAFRDNTVVIYVSCQNNIWYWQYTPTKIGKKILDINFTDTNLPTRPIQNSPFVVDVIAGPIAANNTFAVGQGLSSATAGVVAVFYVYVVDQYGNNITVCEDMSSWSVTLTGPDSPPVNFSCTNAPPYVGRYIAYKKGTHTLSIRYSNTHIHGSPFLPLVVPGPIYNGTSYAQGPATVIGTVGVLETFQIIAVDRYQNLIDTCDNSTFSKWGVELVHRATNKTTMGYVDGCSGGSYIAHYFTTRSGNYHLWVYWNKDNTLYSPFNLVIAAGNVNASHSIASGPGVNGTVDIIAGSITTFQITTYDSYDNPVTTCINDFRSYWNVTLHLSNNATVRVQVADCNAGIYVVYYNVTVAGQVIVYVHGNNVPTIGSPYVVNIIAGDADPLHSLIKRPVPSGEAGQTLTLSLELYDKFGNRVMRCTLNNADFDVYFADNSGHVYRFNVSGCQDGTYTVTFTLVVPGLYYAHAKYKDQEIQNSPQPVTITEGGVNAKYSYADGQGVYAQDIVAGTTATFHIHSVNQYNVTLSSDQACVNFAFWQITSNPAVAHGFDIVGCAQGVYTVIYNATKATVYEITISLNGSTILYSPYKPQVISGPPYPPNTVVTGDEVNKATAHDTGNFTIQVRDIFDNDVTDTSKYDFRAVLTPECVNASVVCQNLNDGRYNCKYSLEEGGVYCISVEYNREIVLLSESYRLNALGGKGCTNSCSHNGICLSKTCYCLSKYTTDDCSKKISSKYMSIAAAIGIIIGVGIFLLIVGILIGVFVIRRFRRGPDNQPLLA